MRDRPTVTAGCACRRRQVKRDLDLLPALNCNRLSLGLAFFLHQPIEQCRVLERAPAIALHVFCTRIVLGEDRGPRILHDAGNECYLRQPRLLYQQGQCLEPPTTGWDLELAGLNAISTLMGRTLRLCKRPQRAMSSARSATDTPV